MGKFKLNSSADTPLDPQAFEKQFVKPTIDHSNDFTGVADQLEFVAPNKVDAGYGTLGNSGFAQQVIAESKAQDQGALELVGKGLANVVKTVGIEIAKTPGYLGGLAGAGINEVFGDGKNSMSLLVDNAWVNAFESLDQAAKEAMPVYMSRQVQEGNLLDKLGSGAWWAESGADGLGFMLAMFAPGAAAKALNIGSKLASIGEGLSNLAPKLSKWTTGKNLIAGLEGTEMGLKYSKDFARNLDGYASTVLNTTLEASAEAANTFDNVKQKYLSQGLSEDEAKSKAGEAASAVFKGNLALLALSNYLDEMWIWKTIGSAGEKEAAQSILSKVIKNGEVDLEALKKIPQEFTKASVLKRTGKNIVKNFIKEGVYEEGSQTTLQQNVEKGEIGENFLDNLYNVGSRYLDDFANNTELHESIFLGGLLGGGASVFGTVRENNALKAALAGSEAKTKDNSIWVKMGIFPETKAQKGLINLVTENHINQFRSYKDVLENTDGDFTINEQKLAEAHAGQIDNLRTNILYDISAQSGDLLGKQVYGQFLAANYVSPFLGQEGGREIFEQHVKEQVVPAWTKRFSDTFGREATAKEISEYEKSFKESGLKVFDAHNLAEQTNYPERYFYEKSKTYQDFRQEYFTNKLQTLIGLDAVKERKSQIEKQLFDVGLTTEDLEDVKTIKDPVKRQLANFVKDQWDKASNLEDELKDHYPKFFTKSGVKEMFDAFQNRVNKFKEFADKEVAENVELKEKVDALSGDNLEEMNRIVKVAEDSGYPPNTPVPFVDNQGNEYTVIRNSENGEYELHGSSGGTELSQYNWSLKDLNLTFDDISVADSIAEEIPESVKRRIARKLATGKKLNLREGRIASTLPLESPTSSVEPEKIVSETVEDSDPENNVTSIEEVENKKKGLGLYPSTGRNLQSDYFQVKPGIFAEKLTDKPSQKLWFEVLENEVSKSPDSYEVQVVRKDDKSNKELWEQINRDSDPGNTNPDDLYTVLYKNGKPVIKNQNTPEFIKGVPPNDIEFMLPGSDLKYRIFGVAKTVQVHTELGWEKSDGRIILRTAETQGYKLVSENNSSGNYVFSSLWRPDNLYPVTPDGRPAKFILAEKAILEHYLFSVGLPKAKLSKLSKADKETLKRNGVENPTEESILTRAFFFAKDEYRDWYNSLTKDPGRLSITKVTGGHSVKMYQIIDGKRVPYWGKIPQDLLTKSHRFQLSITGVINVNGTEYSIDKGDLVLVDNEDNVHPMRSRKISEDEAQTILYLISLRAGTDQATETIVLDVPEGIQFGNNVVTRVPVFYKDSKKQSHQNIIETLISFGSKSGGKGEIYFNKESIVNGNPVLVYTDFNGETKSIDVAKVKQAVDTKDFSQVEDLLVFLQQKKFNINEHLLGAKFNQPRLTYSVNEKGERVPELKWELKKSYESYLIDDVLTTTTQHLDGYPKRVQRNLHFLKQPVPKVNLAEETTDVVETKPTTKTSVIDKIKAKKASLDSFKDMDKILTTSDLLKAKLQNGEIIQNCK